MPKKKKKKHAFVDQIGTKVCCKGSGGELTEPESIDASRWICRDEMFIVHGSRAFDCGHGYRAWGLRMRREEMR